MIKIIKDLFFSIFYNGGRIRKKFKQLKKLGKIGKERDFGKFGKLGKLEILGGLG